MLSIPNPDGWLDVGGMWFAIAADGVGHHDGTREYAVHIFPAEFGHKYYVGGEIRFTHWLGATRNMIFVLPDVAPSGLDRLRVSVKVCEEGANGRLVLVGGLQVRAIPRETVHMPAWRCRFV